MVVDNVDVFEFPVSTEYLLQIFLRRVQTEAKYTQYITGTRVELRVCVCRGGGGWGEKEREYYRDKKRKKRYETTSENTVSKSCEIT